MPRWMWRLAGFSREPGKMPQAMCKRLAYDDGKEMARHKELSKALTLNVFFCDPHASRQRLPTRTGTGRCATSAKGLRSVAPVAALSRQDRLAPEHEAARRDRLPHAAVVFAQDCARLAVAA